MLLEKVVAIDAIDALDYGDVLILWLISESYGIDPGSIFSIRLGRSGAGSGGKSATCSTVTGTGLGVPDEYPIPDTGWVPGVVIRSSANGGDRGFRSKTSPRCETPRGRESSETECSTKGLRRSSRGDRTVA